MDAESKERARDYLAADIFLTTVRLGGDAAIDRLPKETLRRAEIIDARNGGPHRADRRRSADRPMNLIFRATLAERPLRQSGQHPKR